MPTPDERSKRVFITSTYDLHEPRQLIADAIRRADATPVVVEPWESPSSIARKVRNSDLVLALIGWRYGSLAFGRISFPEYEYRLARTAGIPVAAVLLPGVSQADDRQRWFVEHWTPDFQTKMHGGEESLPESIESFLRETLPKVERRASEWEKVSILRVNASIPLDVATVAACLLHITHAYDCITAFLGIIDDAFVALRPELPTDLIRPQQAATRPSQSDRRRVAGRPINGDLQVSLAE